MPGLKRSLIVFGCCSLLAIPAIGALPAHAPPAYGKIILPVEAHFELSDRDGSGNLSLGEYVAVSEKLKNQAPTEARLDFDAMDINGDGALTLEEFYGELPSELTV